MKHRFSLHDVAAEVGCLKQKFLGFRLANIYDINAKVSGNLSYTTSPIGQGFAVFIPNACQNNTDLNENPPWSKYHAQITKVI
jgi:hypothetical protein